MKRHRLRSAAAAILGETHRTGTCGKRCDETVSVIRTRYGTCGYAGLETCGSVWTCPVCASKVATRRASELAELVNAHQREGLPVFMVTLTLQHHAQQSCEELRQTVSAAWTRMNAGAPAQRLRAELKLAGYVRSLEVTHGAHGWHPHLHALVFVGVPMDDEGEAYLADRLWERWEGVCKRLGVYVDRKAFELERARDGNAAAEYISKWGAACEIALADKKQGRGGRSPWQLLDAASKGDRDAALRWLEYASAFHRARHITYSRGIREFYGLRVAATDEELASDEAEPMLHEGEVSEVYRIDKGTWASIVKAGLSARVLDVADKGGGEAVFYFLQDNGIAPSYERVPDEFRRWQPATDFNQQKEQATWNENWTADSLWDRRWSPAPEVQQRQLNEALSTSLKRARPSRPGTPLKARLEALWLRRGTRAQHATT